jgi:hypothetical protein
MGVVAGFSLRHSTYGLLSILRNLKAAATPTITLIVLLLILTGIFKILFALLSLFEIKGLSRSGAFFGMRRQGQKPSRGKTPLFKSATCRANLKRGPVRAI